MNKILIICLCLISCISCNQQNEAINADFITIGTFNIQWLGDGIDDNVRRSDDDFAQIADIIASSGMDIIAVQEVENETALAKLTSFMEGYKYALSSQSGKQRVGILYKQWIDIKDTYDYTPLSMDGKVRPGFVAHINAKNYNFDLMVVHLKSTSRYDSTEQMKLESREMRSKQAEIISNWADSMMSKANHNELIIAGDFNDFPARKNNATLTSIIQNPNLVFLTEGVTSCKASYLDAIDHLIVSTKTLKRFVDNSIFVYDFNVSLPDSLATKISDHCPISVQLKINN